jgi:hypothetical protein
MQRQSGERLGLSDGTEEGTRPAHVPGRCAGRAVETRTVGREGQRRAQGLRMSRAAAQGDRQWEQEVLTPRVRVTAEVRVTEIEGDGAGIPTGPSLALAHCRSPIGNRAYQEVLTPSQKEIGTRGLADQGNRRPSGQRPRQGHPNGEMFMNESVPLGRTPRRGPEARTRGCKCRGRRARRSGVSVLCLRDKIHDNRDLNSLVRRLRLGCVPVSESPHNQRVFTSRLRQPARQ